MKTIALVTATSALANDYDMPPLISACQARQIGVEVHSWDDQYTDWSRFGAVVLRSPWDYAERLSDFLAWCERVTAVTRLLNPLSAVRWSLDKHYLKDLERLNVPVVPSCFIESIGSAEIKFSAFEETFYNTTDFVVKPTVGCYSQGVQRFSRLQRDEALLHIEHLLRGGAVVLLQPYLKSIDEHGETNLIYFDGNYSHAIRKEALLLRDGTVNVPTFNFRAAREADFAERQVAEAALAAVMHHLNLDRPLLYARVDLIRNDMGTPVVLELEIAEPSLSLPLSSGGAGRFADVLDKLIRAEVNM